MAKKLSVLEILLIIFILIVLAVDILLLLLVLEKPSGKGGLVAAELEGWVKEAPLDSKEIILFLHFPGCH
jgi:hypothetical protein